MSPQSAASSDAHTPQHTVKTSGFDHFGLPPKLLQSIHRMNFTTPTPVQAAAIPLAMAGKDILGSAQTGTGKTGAFGIPLIAKLMEQADSTALVMTPTRELAAQVADMLAQLIPVPNIKLAVLIGGEAMPKQFRQLTAGPRIIVGTPGRINDHLRRSSLKLSKASFLVLDETDRMLDMGFGPQLDEIMKFMPKERQTMMFSATLPDNIVKLSRKYMDKPERVAVGSLTSPITKIKQETIKLDEKSKYEQLMVELEERKGSIVIFVKTKFGAQRLSDKLCKEDHRADAIHGDLQQRKRDRVIADFREKRFRILVATDVAARGLDIPHIEHVINYDLPQVAEDYIHRIGRTARAGAEGSAVNFVTPIDGAKWRAIYKLIFGKLEEGDDGRSPRAANDRFGKGGKRGGGAGRSASRTGERSYANARPFRAHKSDAEWDRKPRGERAERPAGHTERAVGEKPARPFDRPRSASPMSDRFADKSRGPRTERAGRPADRSERAYDDRPARPVTSRDRPAARTDRPGVRADRPAGERSDRPVGERSARPAVRADRPYKPTGKSFGSAGRPSGSFGKPSGRSEKPSGGAGKPAFKGPRTAKPAAKKPKGWA